MMHTEPEWRQWLMRKAVAYGFCEADAEDLVQACLHAFQRHFHFYPWEQRLEGEALKTACGWCATKLHCLALDFLDKPARQRELLVLDTKIGEWLAISYPEEELLIRIAIEQFIDSLPAYLRRVASLYNLGYEYADIAVQLGISVGTVRQYMGRIKRLGQAFFGLDVHKSAVCAVNKDGEPAEGSPKRMEEVQNDAETQGIADERVGVDDSELGGASEHPRRPRRTQRGGVKCPQALSLAKDVAVQGSAPH